MRTLLLGLVILLVMVQGKRDVLQHLINSGEFKSLIQGDLQGFARKAALSQATGGMSDKIDNLLGGSNTDSNAPFSLGGKLSSGWHSKNAI
jgi:ABC-type xylose transport system substrate-binding protein